MREETMLKGIAVGFVLSMMFAASCSSSNSDNSGGGSNTFDCDNAKSKCPNDPPLPPATCKAAINDPKCGKVFLDVFLCIGAHQTCKDDGTTDTAVTDRECASQ